MSRTVYETDFPDLKLLKRGKVRDIYELEDGLLMVATDRISAFDVVMPNTIPDKGKVLTQISLFWFDMLESVVPNHVLASRVEDFPKQCQPYAGDLEGRSMFVKKTNPLPIECVVRGYISGSGWKSYQESKTVCGIQLPDGLLESDKLAQPIFTPSTKEEMGLHDINIDFQETVKRIGSELAEKIKQLSLDIYKKGAEIAGEQGIIIADTKFEFGVVDDQIILIDEVLTPDSSRFWPKSDYQPGGAQKSFDKQYIRDYLISLSWNKKPPAPELPEDVVQNTRAKYIEALNRITQKNHAL